MVAAQVSFEIADCTTSEFAPESYDVIYSRDTLLHIHDKPALFKRCASVPTVRAAFAGDVLAAPLQECRRGGFCPVLRAAIVAEGVRVLGVQVPGHAQARWQAAHLGLLQELRPSLH